MENLGELIKTAMTRLKMEGTYAGAVASLNWTQVAGKEIAKHCCLQGVKGRTATIVVDNPVWCHHLMTIKQELIHKINTFSGLPAITDIRFLAGNIENRQNEETFGSEPDFLAKKCEIPITERDYHNLLAIASPIQSEEVRKKFVALAGRDIVRNKLKTLNEWHPCEFCSTLCPPDQRFCLAHAREDREQRMAQLRKLLQDAPWLTFKECREYNHCNRWEYERARRELMVRMYQTVYHNLEDMLTLFSLIMLKKHCKPEAVTELEMSVFLDKIRRRKNVSASWR